VLLAIVWLLVGAALLTVGAEAAIRGVGRLATERSLSPFLLGALLFGIDVESLGAALIAAGKGQTSIAAGEAFGTIVFLLSAALGAALLLSRRPIPSPSTLMVLLPAATLVLGALALRDQSVSRAEGAALVAAYAGYVSLVVWQERTAANHRAEQIEKEAKEGPPFPPWIGLVAGLALVYGGASVMLNGGIRILERTSLAAGFVGAALLGALAALDEIILEVVPVLRGMPEMATGNLFGTVAAFSTGVLGLAALVRPLIVDSAASFAFLAAAGLYTVIATTFLWRGRAGRLAGLTVLGLYAVWLVLAARS
jgi:cation:H+ antiporter